MVIAALLLLFFTIYLQLDGFGLLDPNPKMYLIGAAGFVIIPSSVASITLYCKGLAKTKHGKW